MGALCSSLVSMWPMPPTPCLGGRLEGCYLFNVRDVPDYLKAIIDNYLDNRRLSFVGRDDRRDLREYLVRSHRAPSWVSRCGL